MIWLLFWLWPTETLSLVKISQVKNDTVSPFLLEALERIKNGTYGVCKYCGKEIPVGRLLLVVPALQCVECENKKKLATKKN